jgi:hypothetical protein
MGLGALHWEVLVVTVGAAATEIVSRIGVAALRPTPEQLGRAASRRRRRNTVVVPAYVPMAIGFGLIAGSIPSYWPDVVLGLMIFVIGVLLPVACCLR